MQTGLTNRLASAAMGLALLISLPASHASAQTVEKRSVAVRFADLDLANETDAGRLEDRIRRAAKSACGSPDIRDLRAMQAAQECRTAALEAARPEVELAIAAAKSGKRYAAAGAERYAKPVRSRFTGCCLSFTGDAPPGNPYPGGATINVRRMPWRQPDMSAQFLPLRHRQGTHTSFPDHHAAAWL